MTQIKIEVPANDTIALNAFAEALQRIVSERTNATEYFDGTEQVIDDTQAKFVESTLASDDFEKGKKLYDAEIERMDAEQSAWENLPPEDKELDEVKKYVEQVKDIESFEDSLERVEELHNEPTNDALDTDGIPWDKRIHSKGKSRLADDTWRLRKRPADKDEDEWTTYIDTVKAELKAVQNIPVEPTLDEQAVADVQESETVTPPTLSDDQAREEIKEQLEAGEVVIQAPTEPVTPPSAVVPPVAAVTPPASLTPPATDEPTVKTFPELMKYITTSAAKRGANNDMIKEVLLEVDASLTAIPLIANRVDLIPVFVEKLEARLV